MSKIIDGRALAADIKERVAKSAAEIKAAGGKMKLAVVLAGDDPASVIYVNSKKRECEAMGMDFYLCKLPASVKQSELNARLSALSNDKSVTGVLLQLPLPDGLDADAAVEQIDRKKDVDGLTLYNFGSLVRGVRVLAPCTALGILHAIKSVRPDIAGQHAVIIGRSNIVGKPTSLLLTAADATVTLCHSKTKNLAAHTRAADIIVVAAGKPKLLTADMVKSGAIVIDVGINRTPEGKITGDVDFEAVGKTAFAITPVPGGIGLLTRAFLLHNIVEAYKLQNIGDK